MPDPALRPWLVGMTRDEAFAEYGSRVSGLFVFTPPRFSFTRAEQLVLRQSLAGDTDLEIASHLSISRWTVKKRWQSIYDRVDGIDDHILPANGRNQESGARGAERRRHLLAYLRQHLEELRPLSLALSFDFECLDGVAGRIGSRRSCLRIRLGSACRRHD